MSTPDPFDAPPRVAVVDYGLGNLASVAKALARSGADVRVTESAAEMRAADAVVLPGVGAFRDAAARLEQSGLGAACSGRIAAGAPFLGVCLGLQLLFESSGEGGRWPGLGVLAGTVERLRTGLKVPHIGWNDLEWGPAGAGMARGLPAPFQVCLCLAQMPFFNFQQSQSRNCAGSLRFLPYYSVATRISQ